MAHIAVLEELCSKYLLGSAVSITLHLEEHTALDIFPLLNNILYWDNHYKVFGHICCSSFVYIKCSVHISMKVMVNPR